MNYDCHMIYKVRKPRSTGERVGAWARRSAAILSLVLLAMSMVQSVVVAQTGRDSTSPSAQPSLPQAIPATRQAKNIAIITIDRVIDATMERSVERRINEAAAGGADAIVFELDTPGGELGAVLHICEMIKNSPVTNTVAWVHTKAYSGGAIIALACREIITSEVTRFGDAAPIQIGRVAGQNQLMQLNPTERQKLLAPLLTEMIDSARRRGYDEKLVQGFVMLGVELWLVQNSQTGQKLFIDRAEHELLFGEPPTTEPLSLASGTIASKPTPDATSSGAGTPAAAPDPNAPAPSISPASPFAERPADQPLSEKDMRPASPEISEELLRRVSAEQDRSTNRPILTAADKGRWVKLEKISDGTSIFTLTEGQLTRFGLAVQTVRNDAELKSFFGASNAVRLDESWSEHLVLMLSHWFVRGFLIVVFLVSLFIEMTHPGLVLPGAIAAIALITLIIPPFINNLATWWEIAAIFLGIVLLALELFVLPGFGVAGISGLLLLLFGLVGIFVSGSATLFPGSPAQRGEMLSAVTTLLLSITTASVIIFFVARHLGSIPLLNRLVLHSDTSSGSDGDGLLAAMDPAGDFPVQAGDEGTAITPLRPAGRVQVGDRIVDVVSELGFVDSGAKVRITSVDEFRITVERA